MFGKMKIKRGKLHTFVGMNLEILDNRRVKVTMKEYLTECIEAFESHEKRKIKEKANTPAKGNLFFVDENSAQLRGEQSDLFHHIVSKLVYVSKRARLDIDLSVSFLYMRVSKSTLED